MSRISLFAFKTSDLWPIPVAVLVETDNNVAATKLEQCLSNTAPSFQTFGLAVPTTQIICRLC